MSRNHGRALQRWLLSALLAGSVLTIVGVSRPAAQTAQPAQTAKRAQAATRAADKALATERALAATISEKQMLETVRRLVGFGTRMYGTPSGHDSATWLAGEFKKADLDVTVRQDPPRAWYLPVSWEVRAARETAGSAAVVLKTSWPSSGAPSGKGEGLLAIDAAPGAVCLTNRNPTPETTAGCVAVLFDGRASASGWPGRATNPE